ncbi:MAG: hypothetical protein AAFX85_01400, partial [Pseudomonadota bacterium]
RARRLETRYRIKDAELTVQVTNALTGDVLVYRTEQLSQTTEGEWEITQAEVEERVAYHVADLLQHADAESD